MRSLEGRWGGMIVMLCFWHFECKRRWNYCLHCGSGRVGIEKEDCGRKDPAELVTYMIGPKRQQYSFHLPHHNSFSNNKHPLLLSKLDLSDSTLT